MENSIEFNAEEWFKNLDITWKRIFKQEIDINRKPTLKDIEEILNLESIDCSKSYVISLEPIEHFNKIKYLNFSQTKVKKLNKLSKCISLEEIDASNTEINDVTPLKGLINLKKLNISNTAVSSVEQLNNLDIQELIYHNTEAEQKEIEQQELESSKEIILDSLFFDAAKLVVKYQDASMSLIQRKLSLGYNRSGRIMDQLEDKNIVSPFDQIAKRKVLFSDENSLSNHLMLKGIFQEESNNGKTIPEEIIPKKKSFWKRLFG
jgi:DNA translocase FtsK/SpoIIIE-like protein